MDDFNLKKIKETLEYWKEKKRIREVHEKASREAPKDDTSPHAPVVRVHHFSVEKEFVTRIKGVGDLISYIGIPAGSPRIRSEAISKRASKFVSKSKRAAKVRSHLQKAAASVTLSNAYILYLFSKGVPRTGQPPRPVLEPAIQAPWNRKEIAELVAKAIDAESKGQHYKAKQFLTRAGAKAAKAARDWFDDPRNGWPGNAPRTISAKGFDQPGIDTTVMRNAITHIEKNNPGGTVAKVTP